MAKLSIFFIFLCLCLFHGGLSQQQQVGECQFESMRPLQSIAPLQAEGGRTEFWDYNDQQFRCAGVALIRHIIHVKGLLIPSYTNAHLIAYVLQGQAIAGQFLSGCPETYQSSESQFQGKQGIPDLHQKVETLRQGDIVTFAAGSAHWVYNDGNEDLILVVVQDTSDKVNQLDQTPRRFFLAGNPGGNDERTAEHLHQVQGWGNVFRGFTIEVLVEALKVSPEIARKLQNPNDVRGHIILVKEGLQVLRPPRTRSTPEQEQQQAGRGGGGANGLEETICTAAIKEHIDSHSRTDVYNPQAGRFTTVNSLTLPILAFFQLSAERGILHRNALFAPHWYVNANSVLYVTKGSARVQIVDQRGRAVFNGEIREGQVLVVPMNFAAVKQAGNEGFEWVAFNTNDNAMINTIVGRTSAFRGLPVSVIANALQIPVEQAEQLKYNRQETLLFPAGSRPRVWGF